MTRPRCRPVLRALAPLLLLGLPGACADPDGPSIDDARGRALTDYLQGDRAGDAPSARGEASTSSDLALVGATLVDGTGAPPVGGAVVVLRQGRIACAGAPPGCAVPDDAAVVDASGRWIVPGLVDAHVHYSQTGWADGRPDSYDARADFPYEATVDRLRDRPEAFFRSYRCSGVTATFDVGGFPWTWSLRERAESSPFAPHVAAAGPLLSTRDHWLNLPGERQFLYMESPEGVERDAGYLVASGTDAVKVWYLVGETSPDAARFSSLLRVAARLAGEGGTPLIVHATGLWQAKDALRAGAHLLVHSVYDRPVDDEFLELALAQGTFYNPTLTVFRGYEQLRERRFDEAGLHLACVDPESLRKARLTNGLPAPEDPAGVARAREANASRYRLMLDNLRRVHEAGVPVVLGTDAGNPLTLHGASVFAEMEAMAEAGLTPMDVLVASTRNGAAVMGRLDDFGTVEAGKIADLLVLDRDPLADVTGFRSVALVVRGGTVHTRAELEYRH